MKNFDHADRGSGPQRSVSGPHRLGSDRTLGSDPHVAGAIDPGCSASGRGRPSRSGIDARSAGLVANQGAKTIVRPGAACARASAAGLGERVVHADARQARGASGPRRGAGRPGRRGRRARRRALPPPRRARTASRSRGSACSGPPPRSSSPPAIRTTEPGACSSRPAAALAGVAASASRMTSQPSTTPRRSRRSASPCQSGERARDARPASAPASSAQAPASRPASAAGRAAAARGRAEVEVTPSRRAIRRSDSMPAPGSPAGPRKRAAQDPRRRRRRASSTRARVVGVDDRPVARPPGTRRCAAWPRGRRRGCRAGRRGRARRS